jgi:ubiquinone/menaquinone biosynthesis C-methylase UbiE
MVDSQADGTGGEWSEPLADAWEKRRDNVFERHRRVSEWLVDQIAPQPGDVVLELAAGPGETGFLAAERIRSAGRLLSTDITPGMVDAARRGAAARGLSNVECRVIDAQYIDLPSDSVDAVLCRFALMLMPEPERALGEVGRVLRTGGRLAYAVFGRPARNPWITLLAEAFRNCGHAIPDDPFVPDGPFFSLAEPQRNRELLHSAGLSEISVEEITEPRRYGSFDEYWDHHTHATGPIAAVASRLTADQTREVQVALEPKLAPFQTGTSYAVPSAVLAVAARQSRRGTHGTT